jgi:putative hydrolase of the HAD superfamily
LDFRIESLAALKRLRGKYKIFLLSNTNSIHYTQFSKIFKTTIDEKPFNSLFDKAYYSHEIGLRKPDAEAFEYVLNENNLKPEETLFIDDSIQNIEGARRVGMPTIHLENGMKIENLNL